MSSGEQQFSPAYQAFIRSMKIGYEQWHDGIGYDFDALRQMTEPERETLVALLAGKLHDDADWRDVETLGAIDTPSAAAALRNALEHGSPEIRMRAAEQLKDKGGPANLEQSIMDAIRDTTIFGGLSRAMDLAQQHPSPRIIEALLEKSVKGDREARVNCAALALYLGGQAAEAFDWNHRPFLLRFGSDDPQERMAAYRELCGRIGVEPHETENG